MKFITKFMLTLAMLVVAAGGANGKTLDVDLSKLPAASENTTWDSGSNTFAWSGTSYNSTELFGSGNYSAYTTLNYDIVAGTADHFRIILKFTNGTAQKTLFASCSSTGSIDLSTEVGATDLAFVQTIRLSGAADVTGDVVVNSISLNGPDINYIEAEEVFEAPEGTTALNDIAGDYAALNIDYPKTIQGQAALLFGDGNGDGEAGHANVTDYDYLCFEISSVSGGSSDLRVWIWDGSKVVTLRPHPIDDVATVTDWTAAYSISTPGTYAVKISDYDYLKGAKTNWGSSATMTISTAYLSKGAPVEYVPSGKYTLVGETPGSVTLTAALADASATCYDATGVTGTGIGLVAENPNALFIANEGQLTNTTNVIVNGTCANLVLTDQKPFKAPSPFTATNAEFTKTVSDAGYATMVIPFDAALPEGVLAYNITGSDGDKLVKEDAESIEANKPIMLKNNGTFKFTATNAAIAATPDGVLANGLLCGVYNTTVVPAEGYVLQSQDKGVNFYKAGETGVEVNAFRAYLADATTTRLFFNLDDDVTGISEAAVSSEAADSEIYNLNGQRVANAQKGLYIVGGKKVMVK